MSTNDVATIVNMLDDTPDYTKYTLADLYDVEKRIDREKFSARYQMVHQEIALREQRGELDEMLKPPPKLWSINEAPFRLLRNTVNFLTVVLVVTVLSYLPLITIAGGDNLYIENGKYYVAYSGRKREVTREHYKRFSPYSRLLFLSFTIAGCGFVLFGNLMLKVERDRKTAQELKAKHLASTRLQD